MNNKLYLIRGNCGSGKSTYAKKHFPDFIHLEADMFHYNEKGEYDWSVEKLKRSHDWCFESARIFLQQGKNVVISNTFKRYWEMGGYLELARRFGIEVTVLRMKNRYKNIHGVPEAKVNEMEKLFEDFEGEVFVE